MYLGVNSQEMTFNFDTGSDLVWFPLANCTNCTPTPKVYNHVSGGANIISGVRDEIRYMDGTYALG